jgi:hypothetical protein
MPAIFQTSASNEIILWFMLYLLVLVWFVSWIDKLTGFLDELDQFDGKIRDERTEVGISSRDPKAQGGGGVRRPQDSPKLILRSRNNRTKIQDFDYTASHGR